MIRAVAALLFFAAVCGSAEERLRALDEAGYRELIQNHRGKIVLVDFWATWCEPCRTEMPLLVSLERNWRSRGLVFVTISADDPEQEREARDFLVKTAVPMPRVSQRGSQRRGLHQRDRPQVERERFPPYSCTIARGNW